jgi:antitoxin ParD1/3/4
MNTSTCENTDDPAVDRWLHAQVGPAYDALTADPSRAVTVAQVKARLAAEHERVTSKAN